MAHGVVKYIMGFLMNQQKCGICQTVFASPGHSKYGLTSHMKKFHPNFKQETYYKRFISKRSRCLNCDSTVAFRGLFKGYAKFCSISCSNLYAFEHDPNRRKGLIKWGKFNGANQRERLAERNKTLESRKISSKSAKASWANKEIRDRMMKADKSSGIKNIMKFNSNPANFLHMKGIFGVTAEYKGTGIIMRSNLERAFATLLDDFEIPWDYEPKTFKLVKGQQIQYTPDFLVNGIYVEIKMKKHQTDKVRSVLSDVEKQHGKKIVMLDACDFFQFCCNIIK